MVRIEGLSMIEVTYKSDKNMIKISRILHIQSTIEKIIQMITKSNWYSKIICCIYTKNKNKNTNTL